MRAIVYRRDPANAPRSRTLTYSIHHRVTTSVDEQRLDLRGACPINSRAAAARQTWLTNGSPARVFHQGPQPRHR